MADHLRDATKKVDFIRRDEALELIDNAPIIAGNENETLISAPKLSDKVYCLPAADVRPVVRARWKAHSDCGVTECPVCRWSIEECVDYNFCPNCGADMRPNLDTTKGENHD